MKATEEMNWMLNVSYYVKWQMTTLHIYGLTLRFNTFTFYNLRYTYFHVTFKSFVSRNIEKHSFLLNFYIYEPVMISLLKRAETDTSNAGTNNMYVSVNQSSVKHKHILKLVTIISIQHVISDDFEVQDNHILTKLHLFQVYINK